MNSETETTVANRDHRKEVTDLIVKMLEDGVAPWQKPWESPGVPMNPTTGREYRGGNAIHLMATGLVHGYDDPRWMTYKQAAENGWQVRKGEKGTHIEFWEAKAAAAEASPGPNSAANGEQREKTEGRRLIHRVYTVFNAKQIEGIHAYERPSRTEFEVVQSGERVLANSGAAIAHDQRDSAFYDRRSDSIHLPPKDAFSDAPGYYGTALHELAHWTGHSSRLNRNTLNDSYRFGDLNYAKEELRAELASVFIAAQLGITHDPANHAAYVSSWIKALKDDKHEIFKAAHDASAAADYVIRLERGISKAEALEVSDVTTDPVRDETEELQVDREAVPATDQTANSAASVQGDPRENSRFVSRFENGTGTVALHDKRIGADQHMPVASEAGRDGVDGTTENRRSESRGSLAASFAAAKVIAATSLGDSAKTFVAQTQSGTYRGEIIGETHLHVIQRLSAQSAIAHMKQLLERTPEVGTTATISYSNEKASIRQWHEHARSHGLTR
jgi:antirestriction protein ArdC